MFSAEGLKLLHSAAHETLDLIFLHAAQMPGSLFTRQLDGFGRATVRNQLCHILNAESVWVCGLRNVPSIRVSEADFPDATSLLPIKREVMQRTTNYIDSLSPTEFNTDLVNVQANWIGPVRSPAYVLLHVLTHAFHHKGQVAAMFRILGYPIGDTDLQRE